MAAHLVLVHSPLVGPGTWEILAEALRERGHQLSIPDLRRSLADGPPYWSQQVETIVEVVAGRPAPLVGHSGAGPLLAAAGGALDSVEGYLFVDAGLPFAGQSWLEAAPAELATQVTAMAKDGGLPPWSEWWGPDGLTELLPDSEMRARFAAGCPQLPLAMFEE